MHWIDVQSVYGAGRLEEAVRRAPAFCRHAREVAQDTGRIRARQVEGAPLSPMNMLIGTGGGFVMFAEAEPGAFRSRDHLRWRCTISYPTRPACRGRHRSGFGCGRIFHRARNGRHSRCRVQCLQVGAGPETVRGFRVSRGCLELCRHRIGHTSRASRRDRIAAGSAACVPRGQSCADCVVRRLSCRRHGTAAEGQSRAPGRW